MRLSKVSSSPITLTNGCHDGSVPAGSIICTFAIYGTADTTDEPVTVTFSDDPDNARPAGVAAINLSSTVTIRDDDPTAVVTLARVTGNTGAITEGGSGNAQFTMTLGRALIAGERIDGRDRLRRR